MNNLLIRYREWRIGRLTRAINDLTESINGIDEELWPDVVSQLELQRQTYAFRRSDLIRKNPPLKEAATP